MVGVMCILGSPCGSRAVTRLGVAHTDPSLPNPGHQVADVDLTASLLSSPSYSNRYTIILGNSLPSPKIRALREKKWVVKSCQRALFSSSVPGCRSFWLHGRSLSLW